jgi:hypothetical protein
LFSLAFLNRKHIIPDLSCIAAAKENIYVTHIRKERFKKHVWAFGDVMSILLRLLFPFLKHGLLQLIRLEMGKENMKDKSCRVQTLW